jgi:hypothetical protein
VTTTEDRARAAMRAIAGTVHDAPPLPLAPGQDPVPGRDIASAADETRSGPPGAGQSGPAERGRGLRRPGGAARPASRGRGHRRRSLLAPVAAAITVVAVAVTLAIIRDIPNGRVATSPPPAASASPANGPATAPTAAGNRPGDQDAPPEYYVAWIQADSPYLVVGNTFTGQAVTTVKAPDGVSLGTVYGAAGDDRTFVVTGDRLHGPDAGTAWFLLRIAPGSSAPARLTPLPVPVRQSPAGVALSPDGATVAVALPGSPATLRVYSVATGALLREWSTTAPGELTAKKVPAGSWQFTSMVLRWSPDGSQLAFAWNASAIRVLDATAPDGNLIASSRLLAAIGTTYATEASYTCHAAQGWQLITIAKGAEAGQGIVCGGSLKSDYSRPCYSPADTTCKSIERNSIGFMLTTHDSRGDSFLGLNTGSDCPSQAKPGNGAYLGWANADGSEVIGSQVCAGRSRFGIFRGSKFTPLPALPVSMPAPAGVLDGTVAW